MNRYDDFYEACEQQDKQQVALCVRMLSKLKVDEVRTIAPVFLGGKKADYREWPKADLVREMATEAAEDILWRVFAKKYRGA